MAWLACRRSVAVVLHQRVARSISTAGFFPMTNLINVDFKSGLIAEPDVLCIGPVTLDDPELIEAYDYMVSVLPDDMTVLDRDAPVKFALHVAAEAIREGFYTCSK